MTLKGKTAIITGAGMGIGKGAAVRFARAGADLTLIDLDESALSGVEEQCRGLGVRVIAAALDAYLLSAFNQGGKDGMEVPYCPRRGGGI